MSRLLGFIRDILIAAALGSGPVADAFFVAFRFPNLFRRLFGEGAFNAAFVPLFAKRLEGEGKSSAVQFAEEALSGLLFILLVLSAICMLAMPWLMALLAPGFISDPAKYDLSVLLTQITFPYLLCMSLVALLSGVLNSMNRFTAAAAAPVLLNVILITAITIAILLGWSEQAGAGIILSIGVFVAGLAQLAMLWFSTRRAGVHLHMKRPRYTPAMKRLVSLGIPGFISGGITQINIVIGTIIATLQAGAVSYLYYADRLYQLPLGIVGVAIGVVLLPDLSRRLRSGDTASAMNSMNRSLEFALLLTLPAAVALTVAAYPIVQVLFERGAFQADDTAATAIALPAFALGLPAFVLIKVFQPGYFAREDTKTPMYYAAVNAIVNVIGSLALFFLFSQIGFPPYVGIALATSIAGWVNALLLWRGLHNNGQFQPDQQLLRNLPLIALACAIMGLGLWFFIPQLSDLLDRNNSIIWQAIALAALVAVGLCIYGLAIIATRVVSPSQLLTMFKRSS